MIQHWLQEKRKQFNFITSWRKLCLNLHYNGENSYLFVNGKETTKFKAKDSEFVAAPLRVEKSSKDFSVDNMKKMNFSVDFDAIAVNDIPDIYKYLTEKNGIV